MRVALSNRHFVCRGCQKTFPRFYPRMYASNGFYGKEIHHTSRGNYCYKCAMKILPDKIERVKASLNYYNVWLEKLKKLGKDKKELVSAVEL